MKYFSAGLTKDGLYAEYKKLAKRYHPDVCREENATEIMQEINAEYDSYGIVYDTNGIRIGQMKLCHFSSV